MNYHNSIHIRYYRNKKSDSYRIISDIYIDIIIRIIYRSLSESIRFIIYLYRIYLHNIPYTIICIYTTVIHRKHLNYYRILHHIIRYTYRETSAYGSVMHISNYYLYMRHYTRHCTNRYGSVHSSVYFRYRLFAFAGPYSDIFVGTVADTFRKNLFVIRHSRGICGHFTKKKRVSNPIFPKSATMTTTPISAFVYFC